MNKVFLSKTGYCKCVQCPKIFWLNKYKQEEAIQRASSLLFENGKKVGILAQDLFGKQHDDIEYCKNHTVMINKTKEFLENKPNVITEATFNYDNNFCMVDILKNDVDGVEIYEVKSSTSVTDIYLDDASFQYYVLSNLGLNVKKVCIVYINNKYVRGKDLNLNDLFLLEDITSIAIEKQDEIRENVYMINRFMKEHDKDNEPYMPMGRQCSKPYKCDFREYCNKLEYNKHVSEQGEKDFKPVIDKEAIKNMMDSLKYPLYFLDYEAYATPIPEIESTRPYQQLPFQYSLHIIKDEDAPLEHKEFLARTDDINFIRHFALSLINNLSDDGSVIVYNKSFEASRVNNELARMYPDLKDEIGRINDNMVDFMEPFRKKKQYCTKEMKGSYSIKSVLPALYSDLSYDNLPLVHESNEAPESFLSLKDKTLREQEEIRRGLLEYCKLDTYAMVKIWEKFNEVLEK